MIARFRRFDWIIFGTVVLFGTMSAVTLLSSSVQYFRRQVILYAVSLAIVFFGSLVDWRWLIRKTWFRYGIYSLAIALLAVATFGQHVVRETKSWITFGGFQFEPSELMKFALIIFFAGFFSKRHLEAWRGKNILVSFLAMAVPALLIVLQPDLGSAITIGGIWLSFLLMSGLHLKRFFVIFFIGVIFIAVYWSVALAPYQKNRITAFFLPTRDPLGINYNVIQSKIAIGSAGLWGKGFGGGTQVKLNFLPVAKTDFLFAAFVEEWGVAGGLTLILTFLIFIYRLVSIGRGAQDNYSRFIVLGTVFYLFIHFLINVGSNLGILPVTGITLPLFSYGGSNLLTTATLLSIIEHIKLESR